MYIITSIKKNIRAISGTNNDVEFHNKLFDTDDCVITFEEDPTAEQVEEMKLQAEVRQVQSQDEEILIQAKIREMAIRELKQEGKIQ